MRKPQTQRVLEYMRDFGSITNAEAFSELSVGRLASRIHDLKVSGYDIRGETVAAKNRYGEPTRFSRYTIGG